MRKCYLDNIRWVTVVLVVIYHVFYMYNSEGITGGLGKITDLDVQYYDAFMYLVYPWFMPVLFVVAGISSSLYLESHSGREFVKSRTLKLLVPSTLGLVAFQFLQGYVSMSLGSAVYDLAGAGVPKVVIFLIMLASGSGVLWFCHLLWIYSLMLLLIRRINTPIVVVYRCGFYLAFFLLGYYVFSRETVMAKLKKYAPALICIGVILCIIFTVRYFGDNYADRPINRGLLYAACAYVGSLAMLSGMARFGDFSSRFSRFMSRNSFGLYVFHYLGISSVALYIAKPGLLSAPLCYLLSLAAGFVFGFGLYAVISRIPVYRWLVLGIDRRSQKNRSAAMD